MEENIAVEQNMKNSQPQKFSQILEDLLVRFCNKLVYDCLGRTADVEEPDGKVNERKDGRGCRRRGNRDRNRECPCFGTDRGVENDESTWQPIMYHEDHLMIL